MVEVVSTDFYSVVFVTAFFHFLELPPRRKSIVLCAHGFKSNPRQLYCDVALTRTRVCDIEWYLIMQAKDKN